jgi:hypothetical protein
VFDEQKKPFLNSKRLGKSPSFAHCVLRRCVGQSGKSAR